MAEFHETRMGSIFYNKQVPELIKAIKDISLNNQQTVDLEVYTPLGILSAVNNYDETFPGITVNFTDNSGVKQGVAYVEYVDMIGIRTAIYNKDSDEPEAIIAYDPGYEKSIYRITVSGEPDIDDELVYLYPGNNKYEALGKFFEENPALLYADIIALEKQIVYEENHQGWKIID